ncbi:MAG: Holliday junction resolvase RuvX [Lachnospiraceae bacterium]|nr:Holliday junction resolvase RuvX [Lachnospiraceae bacterium]
MSKLIGLDYGAGTVGVAIAESGGVAEPLETIRREKENHLRRTCARIEELIEERGVETIVLGLPLNMDGSEGERSAAVRAFAEMLKRRTGLRLVLVDERLTSVEAEAYLAENYSGKRIERKVRADIDNVAAALILQDFIDNACGEDF